MRKRIIIGGGAVAVALIAFVLVWFEPQKLFLDDTVSEADAPGAATIATGAFTSQEHATTGTARVVRHADGTRTLRLDDLDTSNGPDLRVYLSSAPADADWKAFDDDFVELGPLKGNKGDQNYELPAGVDPAKHASVVIWCKRFSVPFGVAPLA